MSPKLTIEQKKSAILAELLQGEKASELAVKYNVNPMTIGKWKKEAREKAEQEEAVELATIEPEVITAVVDGIKEKAEANPNITTKQYIKLDTQLDKLKDGVTSLQVLDKAFHETMLNMLTWANNQISDEMKVSDWTQLVNGIATLHKSIFGKDNVNNVNIVQANNVGGDANVASFKAGFRN
jgi:transposase-like protein